MEILQRFQNKILKGILNLARYVHNWLIHADINMPTVKDIIQKCAINHQRKASYYMNNLVKKTYTRPHAFTDKAKASRSKPVMISSVRH